MTGHGPAQQVIARAGPGPAASHAGGADSWARPLTDTTRPALSVMLAGCGSGYTVAGVDRNEQGLKELPDGIRRVVGDATDPAAAKRLVDQIAAESGPPEVLVNTIGMFRLGEATATTPDDLRVLMDVNLGAALWLSQAVEPYMRQQGKGSIVHVSARPATDPTAGMAAYGLIGWLVGRAVHVALLFPLGMLLGLGISIGYIIYRFGREQGAERPRKEITGDR